MRSFRARIERGRIIVHEPIDLPDGVVYLIAVDGSPGDTEKPPEKLAVAAVAVAAARLDAPPDSAQGHGSSS